MQIIPTEQYFDMVRRELAEKGEAFVRVTGISMQPLLRHLKDGVVIVQADEVHPGDIVLFDRKNGHYALHRVIAIDTDGFSMAGDNQWHVEEALPYDQIVGKVASIVKNGKKKSTNGTWIRIYSRGSRTLAVPKSKVYNFLRNVKHKLQGS